jgi:uncharacterized membrane protein (UPF0127 family)
VKRLAAALDTRAGVRTLWWLIGLLLFGAFVVFLLVGANHPKDPSLAARQAIPGFGTAAFTVAHGSVTDSFCALLAATDAQREKGLMGRHDLGGFDAMVFAWPQPVRRADVYFYNRAVPIALNVAFFDAGGTFINSVDMDPCAADRNDCPHFTATRDFRYALEVPLGDLGRLGVGPGSVLGINAAC